MFLTYSVIIQALPLISDGLLSIFPRTVSPNKDWIIACIWGLLIFQSTLGYGRLLLWNIPCKDLLGPAIPVVGLGFYFAFGGWFNLFGIFNPHLILALVYFGALAHLFFVARSLSIDDRFSIKNFIQSPITEKFCLLAYVVAMAWGYLNSVSNHNFNAHDDFHGYLFFPQKLLQLGELGLDPFSERRAVTGIGIGSLWLAIGLVKIPAPFIHVMDLGVGLLMVGYAIFQFPLSGHFLKSRACLGIAIALLAFPIVNVTPNFISIVVISAIWFMIWAVASQAQESITVSKIYWVHLGIFYFVLVGLKNTYIPYVAISFVLGMIYLVWVAKINIRLLWVGIGIVGITTLCCLLPWMIDLHRSSGTYFYPFLGKGFHASAYGYFPSATLEFMTPLTWIEDLLALIRPLGKSIFIVSAFLMLAAFYMYWRSSFKSHGLFFLSLPLLSSLLNVLAVGYAIGGYGAFRYVYAPALASLVSALLVLMVITEQQISSAAYRFTKQSLMLYCTIFLLVIRSAQDTVTHSKEQWNQIVDSFHGADLISELNYSAYQNLSAAIPRNAGVLLRLDTPFLINRLHSRIFVADYPGSASPGPGMPIGQGPEALRQYLLFQGVEYVVWSYANQANFSRAEYGERLESKTHSWIRTEAKLAFEVQDHFEYFRRRYPNIYDQDGVAIIDLR